MQFVEKVARISRQVFDTESGGDIKTLLRATNGSIVPKGTGALLVTDLNDGQQIAAHTTKFNEAPNNTWTSDNGSFLAFS